MDANKESEGQNDVEDSSVTMLDVLEQEKEQEEQFLAVLGASDEKRCTYSQGQVNRQALYSCLTCCSDARNDLEKCAGVCLACSLSCHENHELVELYTKRNFCCDCPTERLSSSSSNGGSRRCLLNAAEGQPKPKNSRNLYNHNFQGLYCGCKRPYPDPERTTEEVMLQCAVCEDWFHLQHLDVSPAAAKLVDSCVEMICNGCMRDHAFLQDYNGLSLKALEDADESQANITVTGDASICESAAAADAIKPHSDLDKSMSDTTNTNDDNEKGDAAASKEAKESDEPESKRIKLDTTTDGKPDQPDDNVQKESACKRPKKNADYEKGATFWGNDWRLALCKCAECLQLYKAEKVEFLLDVDDSAKSYEERGMKRSSEHSTYEQGIRALASMDRVQQIDAITEYNRMKDKLKEYLQKFVENKQVVTEEDINRFFAEIRNEKNANVGIPHLCR